MFSFTHYTHFICKLHIVITQHMARKPLRRLTRFKASDAERLRLVWTWCSQLRRLPRGRSVVSCSTACWENRCRRNLWLKTDNVSKQTKVNRKIMHSLKTPNWTGSHMQVQTSSKTKWLIWHKDDFAIGWKKHYHSISHIDGFLLPCCHCSRGDKYVHFKSSETKCTCHMSPQWHHWCLQGIF